MVPCSFCNLHWLSGQGVVWVSLARFWQVCCLWWGAAVVGALAIPLCRCMIEAFWIPVVSSLAATWVKNLVLDKKLNVTVIRLLIDPLWRFNTFSMTILELCTVSPQTYNWHLVKCQQAIKQNFTKPGVPNRLNAFIITAVAETVFWPRAISNQKLSEPGQKKANVFMTYGQKLPDPVQINISLTGS